jgi:hypothetical protein
MQKVDGLGQHFAGIMIVLGIENALKPVAKVQGNPMVTAGHVGLVL